MQQILKLCQHEVQSYIIVYGGRQNGKTSLVNQLIGRLKGQTHPCLIDFQFTSHATNTQVYNYIARRIAEDVPQAPPRPTFQDAFEFNAYVLDVMARIAPARCVLIFDELGALPFETRLNLANVLRAMFNARHSVYPAFAALQVMMVGGIELYDLARTEASPLNNVCEEIYLPDLTQSDVVEIITLGFSSARVMADVANEIGPAIFRHTSGHPYLTQRFGAALLDAAQAHDLGEELVEREAARAFQNDPLLRHLRHALAKHQLEEGAAALVSEQIKFSRVDEEMLKLELVGVAKGDEQWWRVRNTIIGTALTTWLV